MNKQIFSVVKVSVIALAISIGSSYVYAWVAPTVAAPGGNVDAPINTGTTAQTKSGPFTATSLTTAGAVTAPSHCIGLACITGWVNAGAGLLQTATGLSADTTVVQKRVTAAGCAVGSSIRVVNADGTVVCQADTTGAGGITGITGGGGVTASAPVSGVVTLNTDTTNILQKRVAAAGCAVGSSIRVVNADGTVVCQLDNVGGGSTPPAGSTFLDTSSTWQTKTGWLTTGSIVASMMYEPTNYAYYVWPFGTSKVNSIDATGSIKAPTHCIGTSCITAWPTGVAGGVYAASVIGDAASGITANPTYGNVILSTNKTILQARVGNSCPAGQYMTAISSTGVATCASAGDNLGSGNSNSSPGWGGGLELYFSTPFIDFHRNSTASDYDVRLINSTANKLTVMGLTAGAGDICTDGGRCLSASGPVAFGGTYKWNGAQTSCTGPNKSTGSCSCPAGYTATQVDANTMTGYVYLCEK